MAELQGKVEQLLTENFAGAQTELETLPDLEKVSGFLIWPGFEGLDQLERQRRLWELLRRRLGRAEQRNVSALLTVTPDELNTLRKYQ